MKDLSVFAELAKSPIQDTTTLAGVEEERAGDVLIECKEPQGPPKILEALSVQKLAVFCGVSGYVTCHLAFTTPLLTVVVLFEKVFPIGGYKAKTSDGHPVSRSTSQRHRNNLTSQGVLVLLNEAKSFWSQRNWALQCTGVSRKAPQITAAPCIFQGFFQVHIS